MKKSETTETETHVQAAHWVVRSQDADMDADELAALRRWRASNSENDAAFRDMEGIWRLGTGLDSDPAVAVALRRAGRRSVWRWGRWLTTFAVAAGLAVAALLVALVWMQHPPEEVLHRTSSEQRQVELPDGTAVLLDVGTTMRARYSERRRDIELSEGQAQFEVTSDPSRPFVVSAGGGQVTAVGTMFQVRVGGPTPGEPSLVTLLEGVVRVDGPAKGAGPHPTATLAPGQQLRFDGTGSEWTRSTVDRDSATAWTEGHLLAEDWPLARLVAEMNRYSQTRLRIADPELADLRISGGFRAGDPDSLVLVLEHSFPVSAKRVGDEIVLSRRPERR